MAPPLVRYSSSLACRRNSLFAKGRLAMSVFRPAIDASPDTFDVTEDFVRRIETVIAFEHDRRWSMPRERIFQQPERFGRNRVGVGIGEEWLCKTRIAHNSAACHMDLAHQAGRQIVEEGEGVEAMVGG